MAAAESEVASQPKRFLDTYFDRWKLDRAVRRDRRFLILGPKGAGKSAAAHYVNLAWIREYGPERVFSTFVDFDELNRTQSPLASLDRRLVGEIPALTDSAWRLFLGVRILDSLLSDQSCGLNSDPQVLAFVEQLRDAGLASDDFPQVLRKVRERRGMVKVPQVAEFERKQSQSTELSIGQVGDFILELVANARTPNRHILAIDGLDKAIGDNSAYWQTLAALVRVTDALTRRFRTTSSEHVYVLVMCRSDVFRRVRFADAAKIAADGGLYMDWAAEAEDPRDVQLWAYLASKARTDPTTLLSFFPGSIAVGSGQAIPIEQYLLQFTRYTPRDITLLFNTLQENHTDGRLSNAQVRRSADLFASRHLLTEMMAEATGLLPDRLISKFEQVLSGLPARHFSRDDLSEALTRAGIGGPEVVDDFGEYLFLQGAIGNYRPGPGYVQFYHRRDAYKFHRDGPWIMHTGLVYAFNIPWNDRPRRRSSSPKTASDKTPVTKPAEGKAQPPDATRRPRRRRSRKPRQQ